MASIAGRRRGSAHADYTWPGYVDALASLLMAFVFLLSFYAVGQMALSSAVSDRDSAIDKLNAQLAALGSVLNVEQAKTADLDRRLAALDTQLRDTTATRDRLTAQLRDAESRIAGFLRERDELTGRLTEAGRERDRLEGQLADTARDRDALTGRLAAAGRERERLEGQLADTTRDRDAITGRLAAAGRERDRLDGQLAAATRERDALTGRVTAQDRDRERLEARIAELTRERDRLQITVDAFMRDRDAAATAAAKMQGDLDELKRRIAGMSTEQEKLATELAALLAERERLAGRLKDVDERAKSQVLDAEKMQAALKAEIERQRLELTRLSAAMAAANNEKGQLFDDLTAEQKLSAEQKAAVVRLTNELAALKREMARLAGLLDDADRRAKEQDAQIVDLGTRLNRALASKVEELSRYRSEFFGRLREALAGRGDVTVVGDRFVFQSEVLFDPAQAALKADGERQLVDLAERLRDIAQRIPPDVDWVLQVDGHTDSIPINTPQFRSNWELSTARAIAVVRVLEAAGIPPERLVAAGHAEHRPLVAGSDPASRAKNRRIELKLTSR